ncbi:MAG TPA: MBL fold metallo-hydrolase, partial [Longimicrobiales bacterium]|nr:MBL fold metallo-hydrolase [Longimicrobiales bacterium]
MAPSFAHGQVSAADSSSSAGGRPHVHRVLVLGLAVAALLLPPAAALGQCPDPIRLTFLDVGQGDAVLVRSPTGQTALIDAGRDGDVVPLLRSLDVEEIDLLVATHPHADHIGGMPGVLAAIPVRFFMDNGQPYTTATYRALLAALEARPDITYLQATPRTVSMGDAEIQVLALPPPGTPANDRSVGLVIRYGSFTAFLSGDSERAELTYFLNAGAVPDVDVLKAPHHGSDNGFTADFLRAARPQVVVVSVGSNAYGHPMPGALAAYASVAAEVHRTDREGSITVEGFSDGTFRVFAGVGAGAGVGCSMNGRGAVR